MAMYCLNMLEIALELAKENEVYEDIASKVGPTVDLSPYSNLMLTMRFLEFHHISVVL
jgi:hypothetical protein